MKTAIRMDDITPDMDWERFRAFKALLDRYEIRPLIGVVPENQDENLHCGEAAPDFWEYVKELQEQGWTVAMHGFRHIYTTKKGGLFPLNHFSEFAGVSYEEQSRMLREGRAILEKNGVFTDLFMTPAHSYDRNTLKALAENGFVRMTDGFGSRPYRYKGLTFYPIPFMLERSFRKKKGFTTMVVHANTMTKKDLARYERMLEEHRESMISYECMLQESPVSRGFFGHAWEYLLAAAKHVLVKLRG